MQLKNIKKRKIFQSKKESNSASYLYHKDRGETQITVHIDEIVVARIRDVAFRSDCTNLSVIQSLLGLALGETVGVPEWLNNPSGIKQNTPLGRRQQLTFWTSSDIKNRITGLSRASCNTITVTVEKLLKKGLQLSEEK